MNDFVNALESLIAAERERQAASGSRDADLLTLATQHGGVEHITAVLQRYGALIARFPVGEENRSFDAAQNLVLPQPKAPIDFPVPENPELKELETFAQRAAVTLKFESLTGRASTQSLLGSAWFEWYQRIRSNPTYGWKARERWTSKRWTAFFFFKYLYASAKALREAKRPSKSGPTPRKKRAKSATPDDVSVR